MAGGSFTNSNFANDIAYTIENNIKECGGRMKPITKDYLTKLSEQLRLLSDVLNHIDYYISGDISEDEMMSRVLSEGKKLDIAAVVTKMQECQYCGHWFFPKRKGQKHCSASCRVLYAKNKKTDGEVDEEVLDDDEEEDLNSEEIL